MKIIQEYNGNVTENVKEKLKELGLPEEQITIISNMLTRYSPGENHSQNNK